MDLQGRAKRFAEVLVIVATIVATYIAWRKAAVEHHEYGAIAVAVGWGALALWVVLGWLRIVPEPEITFGARKKR
jgi:multisubunit Na+/H+ antiporter MnhB subunit